jgi:light-regulated signal transduction histidine kinase (bacteriophytochrome)
MYIIRSNKLKATLIISGFLAIFAIGWVDYKTWLKMSFSLFYLFPIIIITWSSNIWTGISASLLSAVIWGTADIMGGHVYTYAWIPYWNAFVRFGFYLIIVITMSRLKISYEERLKLIQKLEDTIKSLNQYQEELEDKARELTRSNEDLEHFASAAAHDLREPLIVIGGYIRLLHKKYKDVFDSDAEELVTTITDGISRMEQMINGLLSYARIETKGKELKWSNGEKVLNSAISSIRNSIEESGAVVTHDAIPDFMADEVQLSQVFQNLISNAIKFRGKGTPRIHVSVELKNNEWVFAVRDNSIGIAQENFETIFCIFKRVHSKTDYPGCGIGLALCKKIVERHGGRIWVESVPEKGSVFYFTIPSVKQPEIAA